MYKYNGFLLVINIVFRDVKESCKYQNVIPGIPLHLKKSTNLFIHFHFQLSEPKLNCKKHIASISGKPLPDFNCLMCYTCT